MEPTSPDKATVWIIAAPEEMAWLSIDVLFRNMDFFAQQNIVFVFDEGLVKEVASVSSFTMPIPEMPTRRNAHFPVLTFGH